MSAITVQRQELERLMQYTDRLAKNYEQLVSEVNILREEKKRLEEALAASRVRREAEEEVIQYTEELAKNYEQLVTEVKNLREEKKRLEEKLGVSQPDPYAEFKFKKGSFGTKLRGLQRVQPQAMYPPGASFSEFRCPTCGSSLEIGARFCRICGRNLYSQIPRQEVGTQIPQSVR